MEKTQVRFVNKTHDSERLYSALKGLRDAGAERGGLDNVSDAFLDDPTQNIQKNDLVLAIAFPGEEDEAASFLKHAAKKNHFLRRVGDSFLPDEEKTTITASVSVDLLGLRKHVTLKFFLNADSTTVRGKISRMVGKKIAYI